MRKLLALAAPLAVAGLMATAAYGFMAANTVESHNSGFGVGKVTGYHVSGQYDYWYIDSSGIAQVYAVYFNIAGIPTYELNVFADSASAFWYKGASSNTCTLYPASDGTNAWVLCYFNHAFPMTSMTTFSVEAQDWPSS